MKHRSRFSYTIHTLFGRGLVVFAAALVLIFIFAAIFVFLAFISTFSCLLFRLLRSRSRFLRQLDKANLLS